ncbi:hypothetical protein EBBID32_700 [Sphingobium indicum BiD32]|uniref:histidine kinase n=1 Tax=Sphingobium indicum BiD32 TaxID=1301087 RepID=N1MJC2_9SPHN|nr:ATP-binding protein [Sphingobium indicum]CCW15742.1 hypothetical protein EBBID32_700 [Sphingobium indicum BiD32]
MGTTLSFRLGLVMLGGFVLMQLALLFVWQVPGRTSDNGTYGLPTASALVEMVIAMERAGPSGADRLASSYDGSLFTVRIAHAAPGDYREVPDALAPLARAYRAALTDHNMVVDGGPGIAGSLMGDRARPLRFLVPIRLTIWMRDGRVLILTGRPASGLRAYLAQRSLLGFMAGAILLALLWLALRQTTGPLRRLTRTVHAFGEDIHAPDAQAEGSRETRDLALAFNGMKRRIATLVEERTFILAGIAHDMRTYLTRLRLRMDYIADSEQHHRAEQDLEQMSKLLDDNLLFAGIDRAGGDRTQRVDLVALTRDLVEMRPEADRIRTVTEGGIVQADICADPSGLERIFGNLVDNGLRHGTRMDVTIARDGDRTLWRFEDDGPGVPAEELKRLGLAYYRLEPARDRRAGGAGLGLAIVRGLAEAMKASVAYGAARNGGLSVTLSWPASE